MAIPDAFIEDLRARLPVSAVVGREVKLKRRGAEFIGLSPFKNENTESFTVNDSKGFWHDFSADRHGDIFGWFQEKHGCEFCEAVERCAEIAGVPMPQTKSNGHDHAGRQERRPVGLQSEGQGGDDRADRGRDDGDPESASQDDRQRSKREITKTYDYTGPQGELIYQVCRIEWQDGDKRKKTFIQRRPTPEGDGHWIWGLSAGEFVQSRKGDWYQLTDDRQDWDGARRKIETAAEHGLYRRVEFNELKSTDEPVFILEGEKDVDTARGFNLVATTNSGGARHWRPDHAEMFAGLDVVIPVDNDDAGRDRGEIIAKSLRRIARSVRVLDWAAAWPDAPKGADLTDWKEQRGGTAESLAQIVAGLQPWTPRPFESRFGLIMWGDHAQPGEEYEYLVEDLIPTREPVLIQGESQSGKSFKTMGLALAGAQGVEFFGHRVFKPFGVVYCAYEAGKGFRARLRAHASHFGIDATAPIPFGVLTKPIDLWSAEVNTDQLIAEILGVVDARFGDVPLGAVVIDTHNRANPGASEIDSKDVSRIIDRYSRIMEKTGAGIWIIGHKNAAGKHRGNEQLYNNIETAIDISRKTEEGPDKTRVPVLDHAGRQIRVATVLKQREGADGAKWEFVLSTVEVGVSRYGKPRTSCVVARPAVDGDQEQASPAKKPDGVNLSAEQQTVLQALQRALDEHGQPPPPALKLPRSISKVVHAKKWKEQYVKLAPDGETAKDNTIDSRLRRASEKMQSLRVIGRENPWVWITGRAVKGHISPRRNDPYADHINRPAPPDDDLLGRV